MLDINAIFNQADEAGEFLEFSRVRNKLSSRRDLCAFLLLDSLMSGPGNIIAHVHDDDMFLGLDVPALARSKITEEQVYDLVRCGVTRQGQQLVMHAL